MLQTKTRWSESDDENTSGNYQTLRYHWKNKDQVREWEWKLHSSAVKDGVEDLGV